MSFQGKRPEKPSTGPNILIDGYNLAHMMGWLPIIDGSKLAQARETLLKHLASISPEPWRISVVFDARGARAAGVPRAALASPRSTHRTGIEVVFALDQEADEVIEDRIEAQRHLSQGNRGLIVVSNDRRLHVAAKRHKCLPLTCDQFLDRMEAILRKKEAVLDDDEKPQTVDESEKRQALDDFGDLDKAKEWKRAMDPYGLGDLGP